MLPFREQFPRLADLLEQGTAAGLQIGAQVFISQAGETLADFASGAARVEVPMTPSTIMPWRSASKPVAAVALAQLFERGELDFDDPVVRFVPEFGTHGKQGVTLRHILTHTAGFRTLDLPWAEMAWDEILARICDLPLEPGWVPGEKAGYHVATSWFLLGEVVRRVDGRFYAQYVRDEIFEPLGMHDSWIGMPPERFQAYGDRIGFLYNTERGALAPHAIADAAHYIACLPGSSGCGPIRELGRFYEMLLAGGAGPAGVRILLPSTVALLTARHRVGMFDETFRHTLDWGLGFIIDSNRYGWQTVPYGFGRHASPRAFGHGGAQSSVGFADPEFGLVVALVANGTPGEARHSKRIRQWNTAIYEDLGLAEAGSPRLP
jgi:CubicO group peptidase (beta-lactamase class C family)